MYLKNRVDHNTVFLTLIMLFYLLIIFWVFTPPQKKSMKDGKAVKMLHCQKYWDLGDRKAFTPDYFISNP